MRNRILILALGLALLSGCSASSTGYSGSAEAQTALPPALTLSEAKISNPKQLQNAPTVAVRISGLVCDLCVDGIEKKLKGMANVQESKAMPRDGIVVMRIEGNPPPATDIAKTLTQEGYNVHAITLSDVAYEDVLKDPKRSAMLIWDGGTKEQDLVMKDPAAKAATCNQKPKFGEVTSEWQNQGFSSTNMNLPPSASLEETSLE